MVINTWSLVDFWAGRLCSYHKDKLGLGLSVSDIRGKSSHNRVYKYLTRCAGIDLKPAIDSYERLNDVLKVRNMLIHNGGHVPETRTSEFESIDGIKVFGGTIFIRDEFIWGGLSHAEKYVRVIALA